MVTPPGHDKCMELERMTPQEPDEGWQQPQLLTPALLRGASSLRARPAHGVLRQSRAPACARLGSSALPRHARRSPRLRAVPSCAETTKLPS